MCAYGKCMFTSVWESCVAAVVEDSVFLTSEC